MGFIFGSSKAPRIVPINKDAVVPSSEAEKIQIAKVEAEAQVAARMRAGRSSTLLTGPGGIKLDAAETSLRSLLGG